MTATKVECREFGVDSGVCVEEVASYAYTAQEENSRPQNGVLIEEFSETEERKANSNVNRGVTIISVSDDESTLKALSRDVSTEDVQFDDQLPEDQKTTSNTFDELYFNGISEEGRVRLHRIAESIVEDQSSEEPLSVSSVQRENLDMKVTNVPSGKVAEKILDQPDSAVELTKETAEPGETKTSMSSSETLSRQNSQKAQLDDEETDEEMRDLLARVKRQRSVLDEILDKESGRESGMIARVP